MSKNEQFAAGVDRIMRFCNVNGLSVPSVCRMLPSNRYYNVGSCAFYRPALGIHIAVERCATAVGVGRAWSWPGYVIDRTPYGVLAHELGHHVDHLRSRPAKNPHDVESLFSWDIQNVSGEKPLTGYLGHYEPNRPAHATMEWFAENFRLFVTNPDLCQRLRPKFYQALITADIRPVGSEHWKTVLIQHNAPQRIIDQAQKKIMDVLGISDADISATQHVIW